MRVELGVMAFATAVPGIVIGLNGLSDPETVTTDIATLTLIASLLASFGPAALATYLLWRDGALRVAGFDKPRLGPVVGRGLLAFAACFAAVIVVGLVLAIVTQLAGGEVSATGDDGPTVTLGVGSLLAALAISVTAGVSEEVVYRGYGVTRMEQAGWPRAALTVPLLVWSVQHLYAGPVAPLVVGAVGVPLVWLFWRQRSIWPLMIGHTLYDLAIFVLNAGS